MSLPACEPYKIKSIETIRQTMRDHRASKIADCKYNLFNLASDDVFIDLLTDSGTGAMSDQQWAAIMTGDESYAGSRSFLDLKKMVKEIFGFEHFLPTHQGRGAENVLFSVLLKPEMRVLGNTHFDTTKAHIEFRNAHAIDCTVDAAFDTAAACDFKGNIDLRKLEQEFLVGNAKVVVLTVTCNSSGGQPVSMENIRQVKRMCKNYGALLVFDSARFAENAYFIKRREPGYADKSIKEIVKEMFSFADAMTMSAKKDGIVNIGGFVAMRSEEIFRRAQVYNIMFEGFITYGGMAGRDMAALAQGLQEVVEFDYLDSRVRQVEYLGEKIKAHGITIQEPVGGHAIYIDAKKFLDQVPKEEFIAQTLGIELYVEAGIRAVEIGTLLADRDPVTRENRYPKLEFLRLAVPRRTYTYRHMDYIAAALGNVFKRRHEITRGYKIIYEAPIIRHFTVELEPV